MSNTSLFKKILEFLPSEIRTDKLLENIILGIETSLDKNDIWILRIGEDYLDLIDDEELIKRVGIDSHEKVILNLFSYCDLDSISIKIYNDGDFYTIEYSNKNERVHREITIIKNDFFIRVLVREYELEDNRYQSYNCNIYYYDTNYVLNEDEGIEEDIQLEVDQDFADVFNVNVSEAKKYRDNFDKYKDFLNSNVIKKSMDGDNDSFEDLCVFSLPFLMRNLKHVILDGNADLSEHVLDKLEKIIEAFKTNIDDLDEVVISENFINNILSYSLGLTHDILYSRGVIAKKYGDNYVFYYFLVDDNEVYTISKILSEEDAKKLYYKNKENMYVEGLDAFFGITNNRR